MSPLRSATALQGDRGLYHVPPPLLIPDGIEVEARRIRDAIYHTRSGVILLAAPKLGITGLSFAKLVRSRPTRSVKELW